MSSKTLRSLATLVLLLSAPALARAAVLYTFSSQAHSGPSSDFSFVVDDLLATTTIVEANDLLRLSPTFHMQPSVLSDSLTLRRIQTYFCFIRISSAWLSIETGQSHSLVWVRIHPAPE